MPDHALSQEEIDALLRGDTSFDEPDEADLDPLVAVFQSVLDHMAGVVSPVAGHDFEAGQVGAEFMTWEELAQGLISPLLARLDYQGDLQGVQLSVADGSTQQQLRALSVDEPVTVLNKMALALAAGLEERLQLSLGAELSSFAAFDGGGDERVPWPPSEMCAVVNLMLHSSGGDVRWQEVLPRSFAEALVERVRDVGAGSSPTAGPPEAPAAGAVPGDAPAPEAAAPTPPAGTGGTGAPSAAAEEPVSVAPVHFAPLVGAGREEAGANIGLIMDVPLQVTVELGRKRMLVREVLELGKGSLIELEKLAGEPVDVFVNGKLVAKGEVVVIDENFGVKVTSIVTPMERLQNLH